MNIPAKQYTSASSREPSIVLESWRAISRNFKLVPSSVSLICVYQLRNGYWLDSFRGQLYCASMSAIPLSSREIPVCIVSLAE